MENNFFIKYMSNFYFALFPYILIAYLIGSFPFGVIYSYLFNYGNIQKQGSYSIGATNALRIGGKKLGGLVFISDFLKAAIPVYFIKKYFGINAAYLTSFFVIIGHIFPIFLKFRGGKGISTSLGGIFVISIPLSINLVFIWALLFYIFRISSISSLITFFIFPFLSLIYSYEPNYAMIISCLIFFSHRSNLKRLINKTEKKL